MSELDYLIWQRFGQLQKPQNKRFRALNGKYGKLKKYRAKMAQKPTEGEIGLERLLKTAFKGTSASIQRQMIFREGKGGYIVDFYIPNHHLAFEADGKQHVENIEYDTERDNTLKGLGVLVYRIANYAMKYKSAEVLEHLKKIAEALQIKDYSERRIMLLNLQKTIKKAFSWRSGQS